ncbi:MAG: helix-turn-helix domain-containing protein [Deltaproteobacteria bacterium]|nr:MAG: helix-turn-helix domain-containing protein [Deltaproteobacteria bacterium]
MTLHSEHKSSISLGTEAHADPRISHTASQQHGSPGPTGVQGALLSVAAVARQIGVCTATIYRLCARGELPHVRLLNAIRIVPEDLAAFMRTPRSHG